MAPAASHDAKDIKSENSKSLKALEEMMQKLTVSKAQDEINASAQAIATFINGDIEEADAPTKYVPPFCLSLATLQSLTTLPGLSRCLRSNSPARRMPSPVSALSMPSVLSPSTRTSPPLSSPTSFPSCRTCWPRSVTR